MKTLRDRLTAAEKKTDRAARRAHLARKRWDRVTTSLEKARERCAELERREWAAATAVARANSAEMDSSDAEGKLRRMLRETSPDNGCGEAVKELTDAGVDYGRALVMCNCD
jgi:thioesterase domain-containing protein